MIPPASRRRWPKAPTSTPSLDTTSPPLIFAAGSGRLEAVKLLISRGADVNAQDSSISARAAEMAITNGNADVAIYLLQNGADGDGLLAMGVQTNNEAIVKAAVAGKVSRQALQNGAYARHHDEARGVSPR